MTIWVLVMVAIGPSKTVWVNTFDSHDKCSARIKEMEPIYQFMCVKTRVNK